MFAIAELSIKKLKEPAFFIMFLTALLLSYMFSEVDPLSDQTAAGSLLSQVLKSDRGYSLLTSSFFAFTITVIIAVFTGATDIPRDIESRMIMLIMSKPLKKTEYLMGKFLGILGLCAIFFFSTEFVILIAHYIKTHEMYSFMVIVRQFYLFLALLPLCALSVTVSCFLPDLSAMIITAVYLLFSISFSTVPLLVAMLPSGLAGAFESYIFVFYYFFPNFVYFFQTCHVVGIVPLFLLIYALSSTLILLAIANVRIRTRDLI